MSRFFQANIEQFRFPDDNPFVISREKRTIQTVIRVSLEQGALEAQAECVPYKRYGETPEGVLATLNSFKEKMESGLSRAELQKLLPAGAARNALDCLLWDFEAKTAGQPVWQLAQLEPPQVISTVTTISIGTADEMFARAKALQHWPMLKVKLAGTNDLERIHAVHQGAPQTKFILDPNESWSEATYRECMEAFLPCNVCLLEQPFPADADGDLINLPKPVSICADESLHDRTQLAALKNRYDTINIKLDKSGGLTEGLALLQAARLEGFKVMVGCMVSTSLAMAPALLLAQNADFVDLDGPILLAEDRPNALSFNGPKISPATSSLWG